MNLYYTDAMTPEEKRRKLKRSDKKNLAVELGQEIAKARVKAGMTQEEFAHEAGIHRSYICFIEGGQRSITVATLVEVSKALKITPSAMLKRLGL